MGEVTETLLFELERYCNNYFNPQNISSSPTREYPASFLELAERIKKYIDTVEKNNIESIKEGDTNISFSCNAETLAWQKAFARELSIYKRVKFI